MRSPLPSTSRPSSGSVGTNNRRWPSTLTCRTARVKVHHLNCRTLCPLRCGETVFDVLFVETGLVLIDSGFERKDCGPPAQRVGPSRRLIRPVLNPAEAAVN